jgi:transcriptional regulator with XRE-family HTH domain
MNLLKIKNLSEKKGMLLKDLAEKISMSYQNLNRCIRENKISANDLEALAEILGVPVSYFFDEKESLEGKKIIQNGNQNQALSNNHNSNTNATKELEDCKKEVEHLKERLKDKEEMIEILKGNK